MTSKHKEAEKKKHSRRSVTVYILILFFVAILFLILAYFMQERAYAQTAAQILGMI